MLTYALVDRGTVEITGLDQQTGDKAHFEGQYYSRQAARISPAGRGSLRVRAGGRSASRAIRSNRPPMRYWAADYWVTLATSGVLTAWTGALLVLLAVELGCTPGVARAGGPGIRPRYAGLRLRDARLRPPGVRLRPAGLVPADLGEELRDSKRFGWPRPASWRRRRRSSSSRSGRSRRSSGLYLLVQCCMRRASAVEPGDFALGAVGPDPGAAGLQPARLRLALGHGLFPSTRPSRTSTPADNPLGLRPPDWDQLGPLLWGRYRGLFFFAPILLLALPGLDLAVHRAGLEPGRRLVPGLCGGPAGEPELPGMDRRLVDGPAAALPLDPVRDDPRRRAARRGRSLESRPDIIAAVAWPLPAVSRCCCSRVPARIPDAVLDPVTMGS